MSMLEITLEDYSEEEIGTCWIPENPVPIAVEFEGQTYVRFGDSTYRKVYTARGWTPEELAAVGIMVMRATVEEDGLMSLQSVLAQAEEHGVDSESEQAKQRLLDIRQEIVDSGASAKEVAAFDRSPVRWATLSHDREAAKLAGAVDFEPNWEGDLDV